MESNEWLGKNTARGVGGRREGMRMMREGHYSRALSTGLRNMDGITDSMDMSKFPEIVKDREARHAAVHGFLKSRTTIQQMSHSSRNMGFILKVLGNHRRALFN